MKNKYVTLEDLLLLKLKSLYDVEEELVKALPKMAAVVSNLKLKDTLIAHLAETKTHVKRLEKAFELVGAKVQKIRVEAIRGLIKDVKWLINAVTDPRALDAALIGAARYVEHYEVAGYLAAIEWAEETRQRDLAELLRATLKEEMAADKQLGLIAEKEVDPRVTELAII